MLEQELLLYLISALLGAFLIVIVLLVRSEIRMKRLLRGKSGASLEESLKSIEHDLKKLSSFKETASQRLERAEKELERSIQHVGIVRFNPFKGTSGSNQSFATAFLNKKGDGVVLSSIYSRDQTSIFAKPVAENRSSYDLSEEEREAISQAHKEE